MAVLSKPSRSRGVDRDDPILLSSDDEEMGDAASASSDEGMDDLGGHLDEDIEDLDSGEELDIWAYVQFLLWKLLSETPDNIKNVGFDVALPSEEAIESLLSDVEFAPGLLDMPTFPDPPSTTFFKDLPELKKGGKDDYCWGVYVLLLEKPGCRSKIYIGCATNASQGVQHRFNQYDKQRTLATYVASALKDGYVIAHKGLLCWSKIPPVGERYPVAGLFIAMEALFANVFRAMVSRTKDYGLPRLCPWELELMEYDRTCTHTSIYEGIRSGLNGLSLETIAKLEAAAEVSRRQRQKDKREKKKAEDPQAFRALATTYRRRWIAKSLAAKRFFCEACQSNITTASMYKNHLAGPRHALRLAQANGTYVNPRKDNAKAWTANKKAAKQYHCDICNVSCVTQGMLDNHLDTKSHKARAAGIPMKNSSGKAKRTARSKNKSKDKKRHYCKACDYAANSPLALDRHRKGPRHLKKVADLAVASSS